MPENPSLKFIRFKALAHSELGKALLDGFQVLWALFKFHGSILMGKSGAMNVV